MNLEEVKEAFARWRDANKLSMVDVANISYVPVTTIQNILRDLSRNYSALSRLQKLTGIEGFKPTADEEVAFYAMTPGAAKTDALLELAIGTIFIERWLGSKKLPSNDERIQITRTEMVNRQGLNKSIKAKYQLVEVGNAFKSQKSSQQIKKSHSEAGILNEELLRVSKLSDQEQIDWIRSNADELKKAYGYLHILMKDPENIPQSFEQLRKAGGIERNSLTSKAN